MPKMPVTRSDKERKWNMVDKTSTLGVGQFSVPRVGCQGFHHARSTIYPLGEDRDDGRERENESDDLASQQDVEQCLLGYVPGTDVADDSEGVSEEKNEENRADNEDSVDLQEVFN